MDQAPAARSSGHQTSGHPTWDLDSRLFRHFWVHCRHCRAAMNSLGNLKCHAHQCRGINNVDFHCGCCGTQFSTWRAMTRHVNRPRFHLKHSNIPGYDGSFASLVPDQDHIPTTNQQASTPTTPINLTLPPAPCHTIFIDSPESPPSNLTPPGLLDTPPAPPTTPLRICSITLEPQSPFENDIDLTRILAELDELVAQNTPDPAPNNADMSPLPPLPFPDLMSPSLNRLLSTPHLPCFHHSVRAPNSKQLCPTENDHCTNPICDSILNRCTYYRDIARLLAMVIRYVHDKTLTVPPFLIAPDSPDTCPHHQLLRETEWPQTFPPLGTLQYHDLLHTLNSSLPNLLFVSPLPDTN